MLFVVVLDILFLYVFYNNKNGSFVSFLIKNVLRPTFSSFVKATLKEQILHSVDTWDINGIEVSIQDRKLA